MHFSIDKNNKSKNVLLNKGGESKCDLQLITFNIITIFIYSKNMFKSDSPLIY